MALRFFVVLNYSKLSYPSVDGLVVYQDRPDVCGEVGVVGDESSDADGVVSP